MNTSQDLTDGRNLLSTCGGRELQTTACLTLMGSFVSSKVRSESLSLSESSRRMALSLLCPSSLLPRRSLFGRKASLSPRACFDGMEAIVESVWV